MSKGDQWLPKMTKGVRNKSPQKNTKATKEIGIGFPHGKKTIFYFLKTAGMAWDRLG
jgi:hypothetical protein